MSRPEPTRAVRTRRPPPPFRPVEVRRRHRRGPRLITVTLGGPALEGFEIEQPGASIRVLLPSPGDQSLTLPTWNGNEFLLADAAGRFYAGRVLQTAEGWAMLAWLQFGPDGGFVGEIGDPMPLTCGRARTAARQRRLRPQRGSGRSGRPLLAGRMPSARCYDLL